MIRVVESITIQRPAEKVYEYMMNPENLPRWVSGVTAMTQTNEGGMVAGAKGYQTRHVLGRPLYTEWECMEYEPPRLCVLKLTSGPMEGMGVSRRVEPLGDDSCVVTFTAEGEARVLFGMFRLVDPLLNKMYERQVAADLGNLKDLLEADHHEAYGHEREESPRYKQHRE